MTPPGLAFTFHGRPRLGRGVAAPAPTGTGGRGCGQGLLPALLRHAPTHHLYGLRDALDMILEEGLEAVWYRHGVHARAVWAAVDAWGGGGALALNIDDRAYAATR